MKRLEPAAVLGRPGPLAAEITELPPPFANTTILSVTALPLASLNVTVIVAVALPFAATEVGLPATVDCAAVGVPMYV